MRQTFVRVSLVVSMVLAAFPVGGQEPDPAEPAAGAEQPATGQPGAEEAAADQPSGFEEEIVVTSRKREEAITEVPFSVAALPAETLQDRGADDLEDVAANVAGFTVQNLGPGQSQVAIRGVSAGQVVRDQPGVKEQVGVYLDESVVSMSLFTPDLDLFDLNRVEVLRGPQGTLFGSGSLSGTVRYITNQPQLGLFDGKAELSLESVDGGGFGGSTKAMVNAPLGEQAAMRVAAYYTSYAGFVDAVEPGLSIADDVNDGDRVGVRWALRWEPSENVTITPRILYQEVDLNGWNRVDLYNILANPYTTTRPAVDLGDREQFIQFEEPFTDEFLLSDLNVEVDLGPVVLTSVTSYTDRDLLVVRDATALTASITGGTIALPEPVYTIDGPLDDATQYSSLAQELRLSGGDDTFEWVAGAFYSSVDRDYAQTLFVGGFEDLTGIPTAGSFGAGKDELYWSDLAYDLEQLALFGEATYAIGERFDLTGGLRWYDFSEDRIQTFDGIFADPGTTVGSVEADGFAPRLIASYALSEGWNLLAQVSKGFRLGGINDPLNLPLCSPQDKVTFGGRETWKDETLWNYEVGSKATFLGGRGTFNVAGFYQDISDLQVTVTAGTCSSRVIFNVPEAKAAGLELELAAQPTDAFDFALSASYTDATLESTLTSTDAAGNVTVVSGIEEGRRLPTVPELQAAAAATYRWELARGRFAYATGTYQHVGSRYTQVGDQAAGFGTVNLNAFPGTIGGPLTASTFTFDPKLPAYDIVNLRFGMLVGAWDVALFVNNVTDEEARLALDQERGTLARVGYLTNAPRTFGLTARVGF